MKIRTGFVSNSSSSSFCILGCELTEEIREKILAGNESKRFDSVCYDLGIETFSDEETGEKFIGISAKYKTLEELVSLHEKLVSIIGPGQYSIVSGTYAC